MSTQPVTQQPTTQAPVTAQPDTSAQQPATQQSQTQPGQGQDQGLKQLREAYEGVKAKFEPYEKLNLKPEQITQYSGVYQKVYGEAQAVGRNLGYSDEEIAEALTEDPLRTVEFLRNQAQQQAQGQPQGNEDLRTQMEAMAQEVLGPIQQRENVRMTDAANQLFEQTVRQSAVESFKAEGIDVAQIPEDEMFMLVNATSEIMKYDNAALQELKYQGKTAAIQKAFQEARTYLDKYYLARANRDRSRVQTRTMGAPEIRGQQQQGRKPTLDEMIENPGLIGAKYA